MNLYEMSAQYTADFLRLADSEFDADVINDTLEAMEGEIAVKGANVLAYALNLKAEAKGLKEIEDRVAARRKALERKEEWMIEYLKANMRRTGITEIEAIDGTFKAVLRMDRDEALIVDNQGEIPCDYFTVQPETWVLDKSAVKKAIKVGAVINGVHIEKRDRLEVK